MGIVAFYTQRTGRGCYVVTGVGSLSRVRAYVQDDGSTQWAIASTGAGLQMVIVAEFLTWLTGLLEGELE